MQIQRATALLIALSGGYSVAQQTNPDIPHPLPPQPERVTVYSDGSGAIPPTLLPINLPPVPSAKCKQKMDGKVQLSVIVDAAGKPRDLWFLRAQGNDLDKLALQIASAERFTPGTNGGAPVAFAQSLEIGLQACVIETTDASGAISYALQLRSEPAQALSPPIKPPKEAVLTSGDSWSDSAERPRRTERVGGKVSGPIPLIYPDAQFSDEARRAKYQGICLVSLIVDRNGMPEDIKIVRNLDHGLGLKAIEAVNKYRFKPAMKNGEPVPVFVNIEVNFKLY